MSIRESVQPTDHNAIVVGVAKIPSLGRLNTTIDLVDHHNKVSCPVSFLVQRHLGCPILFGYPWHVETKMQARWEVDKIRVMNVDLQPVSNGEDNTTPLNNLISEADPLQFRVIRLEGGLGNSDIVINESFINPSIVDCKPVTDDSMLLTLACRALEENYIQDTHVISDVWGGSPARAQQAEAAYIAALRLKNERRSNESLIVWTLSFYCIKRRIHCSPSQSMKFSLRSSWN